MRFVVSCILACLFCTTGFSNPVTPPFHNELFSTSCCLLISHAGGSILGKPYTNSREALDSNAALGRRVFELDFEKTRDGDWVLLHDWGTWAREDLQKKPMWYDKIKSCIMEGPQSSQSAPSTATFLKTPIRGQFTPMTLSDLNTWLNTHTDVTLITDTKEHVSIFFKALQAYPQIMQHAVFQAYTEADLAFLKSQGIPLNRVIFSNYKSKLSEEALITLAKQYNIGALTLPLQQSLASISALRTALPLTPLYVHGKPENINATEIQMRLKEMGASGFYLD